MSAEGQDIEKINKRKIDWKQLSGPACRVIAVLFLGLCLLLSGGMYKTIHFDEWHQDGVWKGYRYLSSFNKFTGKLTMTRIDCFFLFAGSKMSSESPPSCYTKEVDTH